VAQFYQPKLIRAFASHDGGALRRQTDRLTRALLVTVIAPTLMLWVSREPLIAWWLHDRVLASQVAELAALLLPAAAIGALGNVPLALLIALADFGFQARLSALLTIMTLLAVAVAAWQDHLLAVCWIYLAYYAALTSALWVRSGRHPATAGPARRSANLAVTMASGACLLVAAAIYFL
jgi:O-antigen/teichoic acid export membrane protein